MMEIEREEAIVIIALGALGFIWSFIGVPALTQTAWFYRLDPLIAYPTYNVGWLFVVSIVLGGPVAYLLFDENQVLEMFKIGLGTWLFFSFVYDLWQPAFYMSTIGQVLIPLGTASLENTSVDAFTASVAQLLAGPTVHTITIFGFSLWYVLTYYVASIIALVLFALLLPFRKFLQMILQGD